MLIDMLSIDIVTHKANKHMDYDKRKWGCDLCTKKFATKGHLTSHRNAIHFGKKYSCEYCKKEFNNLIK